MHESTVSMLAIISGSLGSLLTVSLLVCGTLVVVIAVIVRKKGMHWKHHHHSSIKTTLLIHTWV